MNVYRFEIGDSMVKKRKKRRKVIRAKQNRINRIRLIPKFLIIKFLVPVYIEFQLDLGTCTPLKL